MMPPVESIMRVVLSAVLLWTGGSVMPVLDHHHCDESARQSPLMAVHLWRCHDQVSSEPEAELGWHLHFLPIDSDDFTSVVAGGSVPTADHLAIAEPAPTLDSHKCCGELAAHSQILEAQLSDRYVSLPLRAGQFLQTYAGSPRLRALIGVIRC